MIFNACFNFSCMAFLAYGIQGSMQSKSVAELLYLCFFSPRGLQLTDFVAQLRRGRIYYRFVLGSIFVPSKKCAQEFDKKDKNHHNSAY